jgi:ABC-type Fe3+ transport system permease subunit
MNTASSSLLIAAACLVIAYGVACLLNRIGFYGKDSSEI